MTASFTFVSVKLTQKNSSFRHRHRNAGIAAEDRVKIRSLAARNPGNRHSAKDRFDNPGLLRTLKSTPPIQADKLCIPSISNSDRLKGDRFSATLENEDEYDSRERHLRLCKASRAGGYIHPQGKNKHYAIGPDTQDFLNKIFPRLISQLKTDSLDPFWTWCIPEFPLLWELMDHRNRFLTPAIPELDLNETGFLEQRVTFQFFRAFQEIPYFVWAQLLFAAGHMRASIQAYCSDEEITGAKRLLVDKNEELILWMKGCTMNALNKTFEQDLTDVELDGRISTISTLSAFERCFGTDELYRSHLQGIRQLLIHRGGIRRVHPVVRNLMTWLSGNSTTSEKCHSDGSIHEIEFPLNEDASNQATPESNLTASPEFNCASQSSYLDQDLGVTEQPSINYYPNFANSTAAAENWFEFAKQLTDTTIRGASANQRFVMERTNKTGIVIARSRR